MAKSPEISVFTRLREDFLMLSFSDTTDFCFLKIEDELQELKDNVVQMLITTLANKSFTFRGDYTELMRLCLILLTGEVPEGFVISRVGALSNARWMSKAIAAIKLVLLKAKIFSELPPNRIMTSTGSSHREVCQVRHPPLGQVVDQVSLGCRSWSGGLGTAS